MSEWAKIAFGELFKTIYRYPTYFGIQYVDKGVIEIRGELLTANGMINDDFRFISSNTASKFPRVRLEEGDFVMSVRGTIGKIGRIKKEHEGAVITANLLRLSPDRAKAETGWLLQVLLSPRFLEQLENACSQTTIRTIQVPPLSKVRIDCPPLCEQRQIAEILSTLDETIEQTEALIAKYQQIKAGLMHDLFTRGVTPDGKLRPTHAEAPQLYKESLLGWIPKEWVVKPLDEHVRIIDCKHYTPEFQTEGFPFIRPRNVKTDGLDLEAVDYVSLVDFQMLTDVYRPHRGDIVFSRNASFGVPCYIDSDIEFAIGQDCVIMTAKASDTRFVFCALTNSITASQIAKVSGGSTFGRINLAEIRKLVLPYPGKAEEEWIADRLFECDRYRLSLRDELAKLRQQKHGLMHDLLTGRVRVKDSETLRETETHYGQNRGSQIQH
jgi:type I restriction enzyme S subunit